MLFAQGSYCLQIQYLSTAIPSTGQQIFSALREQWKNPHMEISWEQVNVFGHADNVQAQIG